MNQCIEQNRKKKLLFKLKLHSFLPFKSLYGPRQEKKCFQTFSKYADSDSSRTCAMSHPGICSVLMHSVVSDQIQNCLPIYQQLLDALSGCKLDLLKFYDKFGKEIRCSDIWVKYATDWPMSEDPNLRCRTRLHCLPLIQQYKAHQQVVKWTLCFKFRTSILKTYGVPIAILNTLKYTLLTTHPSIVDTLTCFKIDYFFFFF